MITFRSGLSLIVALLCIGLLSGCETLQVAPAPHVLIQNKMVPLEIPSEPLVKREAPRPPEIETYMSFSKDAREDLMVKLLLKLSSDLSTCNAEKDTISSIIKSQHEMIESYNQQEALRVKKLQESLSKGK